MAWERTPACVIACLASGREAAAIDPRAGVK